MMGGDRELLELAAKAAKIPIYFRACADHIGDFEMSGISGPYLKGSGFLFDSLWNPLTDDGDALRLAVHLGILNSPEWVTYRNLAFFAGNAQIGEATRIGIVRAAAEIGSKL